MWLDWMSVLDDALNIALTLEYLVGYYMRVCRLVAVAERKRFFMRRSREE